MKEWERDAEAEVPIAAALLEKHGQTPDPRSATPRASPPIQTPGRLSVRLYGKVSRPSSPMMAAAMPLPTAS